MGEDAGLSQLIFEIATYLPLRIEADTSGEIPALTHKVSVIKPKFIYEGKL